MALDIFINILMASVFLSESKFISCLFLSYTCTIFFNGLSYLIYSQNYICEIKAEF